MKRSAAQSTQIRRRSKSHRLLLERLEDRRVPALIIDLGLLPGTITSGANDVNDSGVTIGVSGDNPSCNASPACRAFLYQNGVMTDINQAGYEASGAYGMNAAGTVVGGVFDQSSDPLDPPYVGTQVGFILESGTFTPLLGFSTEPRSTRALAINDSGHVVGWSNYQFSPMHAFLYVNGVYTDLGTLSDFDAWSSAEDINNADQIVGHSYFVGNISNRHATLWQNGSIVDLGTLGGTHSEANAINSSGQIVGVARRATGLDSPFLWTPTVPNGTTGTMIDLGSPSGAGNCYATDINSHGEIVGTCGFQGGRGFYWKDGTMVDLQNLLPANSGWTIWGANAITDNGFIVGFGNHNGVMRAFRMSLTSKRPVQTSHDPVGPPVIPIPPPPDPISDPVGASHRRAIAVLGAIQQALDTDVHGDSSASPSEPAATFNAAAVPTGSLEDVLASCQWELEEAFLFI